MLRRSFLATIPSLTAGDLYGWGECHAPAAPRVHQTIISDMLAPVLLGQDARDVEALWDRMYSTQRLRGYSTGFYTEAIAGVDIALWDILGKYTNQPLYRLLGGVSYAEFQCVFGIVKSGDLSGSRSLNVRNTEFRESRDTHRWAK